MQRHIHYFALLCALLLPFSTWAASDKPISPRIEKTIRATLADMPIKTIRATPIVGIFELQVGDIIYYSDKTGRHVINGHLFDTRNKKDITAERLAEISRIDWSVLPLTKAVVSGPKHGAKIAIFTDPECPYCKQLEGVLAKAEGLRVYTFLFPLTSIHPDAFAKSESIWCSKDRHQAMVELMLEGKTLAKAKCNTPIKAIMALGDKLNVRGTPTIFAENGSKYAGALQAASLVTWAKGHQK